MNKPTAAWMNGRHLEAYFRRDIGSVCIYPTASKMPPPEDVLFVFIKPPDTCPETRDGKRENILACGPCPLRDAADTTEGIKANCPFQEIEGGENE